MRRGRKRTNYAKKSLYKKVNSNRKAIQRIKAQIERKSLDLAIDADNDCNTTGHIAFLPAIGTGDLVSQRTGNAISGKILMIRGVIKNTHGTPEDCVVRFLIFRTNNEGTAVSGNSVPLFLSNSNLYDNIDWVEKENYKVYYDQTFAMDTALHSIIPFKIRIKLNNLKMTYDGTSGAETAGNTNMLYFAFFSDVAGTTNDPLVTFKTRVVFTDA